MKLQFGNQYLYIRRQSRRKAEKDSFETDNFNWNIFGLHISIGRENYRSSAKEVAIKNGDISGYIDKRWKSQREYFSNKSAKMQSKYQSFQIWIIVLSAISATVLALNFDELFGTTVKAVTVEGNSGTGISDSANEFYIKPAKWFNNRIVCALLTMAVVVLTSIDKLMQYREEWIKNRKASERLKREYCMYRIGAGEYEKIGKDDNKNEKDNDNTKGGKGDDDSNTEVEPTPTSPQNPPSSPSTVAQIVINMNTSEEEEKNFIVQPVKIVKQSEKIEELISACEQNTKHQHDIDELNKKHQNDIDELNKKHQNDVDELNKKHQNNVDELNKKHQQEIDGLKQTMTDKDKERKEQIDGAVQLLVSNLSAIYEHPQKMQDFYAKVITLIRKYKDETELYKKQLFCLLDDIEKLAGHPQKKQDVQSVIADLKKKNQKFGQYKEDVKSLFNDFRLFVEDPEKEQGYLDKVDGLMTKFQKEIERRQNDVMSFLNQLNKQTEHGEDQQCFIKQVGVLTDKYLRSEVECWRTNCDLLIAEIKVVAEFIDMDKNLLERFKKEIADFHDKKDDYDLFFTFDPSNIWYQTGFFVSRINRINKEADGFLYELQDNIIMEIDNFKKMADSYTINDRTAYFLQRINDIADAHKSGPGRYNCYQRLTDEISNFVRSAGEYAFKTSQPPELTSLEKKFIENLSRIAEADKSWLNRHFYYRDIKAEITAFKLKTGDYADKKSTVDSSYYGKIDPRDILFVANTEGIVAEDVEDFVNRKNVFANFDEYVEKLIEKKLGGNKGNKADESKKS